MTTTTTRLTVCLAALSGGLAASSAPKSQRRGSSAPLQVARASTLWEPLSTSITLANPGENLFNDNPFELTKVRCVSDEDCLQHPALSKDCPQFCNDGFCGPNDKGSAPVLRLRTGIKVDHSRFKLREGEELERVFESPPEFYPKGQLDGRFFEVVQSSEEVLEVKYPRDYFEVAARMLESSPGAVDGDKDEPNPKQGDHEDLDGDLDGQGNDFGNDFGFGDTVFPGGSTVFGGGFLTKRGLAIQGDAPARWHPSNTARSPWRRNGRLSMGCTAALIGNRVLVTAAHCVWDRDTNSWGSFPLFSAGQDGSAKPYGDVRVVRMTIPAGYQTCSNNNECRAHDWAVLAIHRDDRLNVGYFGFSTRKANTLNLAGYPQSKSRELWYDSCPLFSDEGKWIKHRCDTEPGNSGSGIYKIVNGKRYVVAIHGGGYTDLWNRGADVDGRTSSAGRLFDRMLAYRREFG